MMTATDTLFFVTAAVAAFAVAIATYLVAIPSGPVQRSWRRYIKQLEHASRGLRLSVTASQIAQMQVIGFASSVAFTLVVDIRLGILAIAALFAPKFMLKKIRSERLREIEGSLNGWLTVMSNMLKATGSITDALAHTAELARGPLGEEIDHALKELRVGSRLDQVLNDMADRIQSPFFYSVVSIMLIGRTSGGQLPNVLEETASSLRERSRLEGHLRRQTAAGRAQLGIMLFAPPVFVYLFNAAEPEFFDVLFSNGIIGYTIIMAAAFCWLISIAIARRILAVEM